MGSDTGESETGKLVCDCGSDCNFTDHTTNTIEHIVTGINRVCNECGEIMDIWDFGVWGVYDN